MRTILFALALLTPALAHAQDWQPKQLPVTVFDGTVRPDVKVSFCSTVRNAIEKSFRGNDPIRLPHNSDFVSSWYFDADKIWPARGVNANGNLAQDAGEAIIPAKLFYTRSPSVNGSQGEQEVLAGIHYSIGWREFYELRRFTSMQELLQSVIDKKVRNAGRLEETHINEFPQVFNSGVYDYLFKKSSAEIGANYQLDQFIYNAPTLKACEWQLYPASPQTTFRLNEVSHLAEYINQVERIMGEAVAGACGGTSQSHAHRQAKARDLVYALAYRPWALKPRDDYFTNPDSPEYTEALAVWGRQSLSAQRDYKKFLALEQNILPELKAYYFKQFNVEVTDETAKILLAKVTRAYLYFYGYFFTNNDTSGEFNQLLLQEEPDVERIKALISSHPEPVLNASREGPVFFATMNPTSLQLLMDARYSPNVANIFGKTPLMYAAHYDNAESIKVLLKSGANVNVATPMPDKSNEQDEVQKCSSGISVEIFGRTALAYAAENASVEVIQLLLDKGADKTVRDSKGRSIRDYLALNPRFDEAQRTELIEQWELP